MLKKQRNNLLLLVYFVVKSIFALLKYYLYVVVLKIDFPKTKLKIIGYSLHTSKHLMESSSLGAEVDMGIHGSNAKHYRSIIISGWQRSLYSLAMTVITTILLLSPSAYAAKDKSLPRFASIKSNQVNARTGPGITYPIEWVFITKGEPIKITAEFEQWRKIEDVTNIGGWVHSSVLSPKRFAIITGKETRKLYKSSAKDSRLVATLEPGLRCALDKCNKGWCKLKCKGYKGWIESAYVWGIKKSEEDEL